MVLFYGIILLVVQKKGAKIMNILISSIGMMLISMGLCEMGYGFNTSVWRLMIIGLAIYAMGWRL